jgi:hypothetical protein
MASSNIHNYLYSPRYNIGMNKTTMGLIALSVISMIIPTTAFAQVAELTEDLVPSKPARNVTIEHKYEIAALNTTKIQNVTVIPEDMCTDNNLNGRCSLDAPRMPGYLCYDTDKDLYCDWFKAPKITNLGVKDCGKYFDEVQLDAVCTWYSDGTVELAPVVIQNTTKPNPMAQLGPLVTHKEASNNDDDNDRDNDNDRESNNDNDNDDLPPCSPSTIYKECADTDYDEREDSNCGGESCTATEKEDSWTDEEVEIQNIDMEESNNEEESESEYEDDGYLDEEAE